MALWRSFKDDHKSHSFYVTFEKLGNGFKETGVKAVSKRGSDKNKIGDSGKEFRKKWIPVRILNPGESGARESSSWRTSIGSPEDEAISVIVDNLRGKIKGTVIPYLSLPIETQPDEAINVFIETNRSSVRLTHFDIAVAQMEEETSESLTEKVADLIKDDQVIEDLENNVGDMVLKVQCLLEGKKPTFMQYRKINFQQFNDSWQQIVEGIKWTVATLSEMNIWTSQRLPTTVPLRVLPALHRHIPKTGTGYAKTMKLIRRYLWWSFLTDRYERQANDRLKEDHDFLVDVLQGNKIESDVLVFQCKRPTEADIKIAGWPTAGGRLSQAILVACSLGGASDIASNRKLSQGQKVDFHHIFPIGALDTIKEDPDFVLNCMLLEPLTNKEWAKKWPGDYLIEMVNASKKDWGDPEKEVEKRLETHLLPPKKLIPVKETHSADLGSYYRDFLDERAKIVMQRIETLLDKGELG